MKKLKNAVTPFLQRKGKTDQTDRRNYPSRSKHYN